MAITGIGNHGTHEMMLFNEMLGRLKMQIYVMDQAMQRCSRFLQTLIYLQRHMTAATMAEMMYGSDRNYAEGPST